MIYIEMEEKINNIMSSVRPNTSIYIFGAGWVGKLVLRMLKKIYTCKIIFLDNNKTLSGTFIENIPIYNPTILKDVNKDNILILVASFDNTIEINNQLLEYGFEKDTHFYNLLEPLKYKMVKNLIDSEKSDIYILGDSVMNIISYKDNDIRTLYAMVKDKVINTNKIGGFYFPTCHIGIHYLAMFYLINFCKNPNAIVLPINMGVFSYFWDTNPICENVEIFNMLYDYLKENNRTIENTYGLNIETPYEKFLEHKDKYCDGQTIGNDVFQYWFNCEANSEEEYNEKYKYISIWLYNYNLDVNHRKVVILRKLLELCVENKIKVAGYITPINYEQCEKYVGNDFVKYYNKNVDIIKNLFEEYIDNGIQIKDFSYIIESDGFVHENDTVHLNEKGRLILSTKISNLIKQI